MFKTWERMESHRCRYFYIKSNLCISLGSTVKCLIYYRAAISIYEQFLWPVKQSIYSVSIIVLHPWGNSVKKNLKSKLYSKWCNSQFKMIYECDLSIKSLEWFFTQQTMIDTKMKMSNLIVSISFFFSLRGPGGKAVKSFTLLCNQRCKAV